MGISYQVETSVTAEDFIALLKSSTLGERRPVNEPERIESMLRNANLIITARDNGKLVGIARSITDHVYATYLSDLAVHKDYQRNGIGKELIRRTKIETPQALLILLSAPAAITYYPRIGMTRHENAFILKDAGELK